MDHCPNCDALLLGPYCQECGQAVPKRITWRSFTDRFFERYLDIDQGIPHTFLCLLKNPGDTTRGYLNGQRKRYSDPVKFMLIAVSVVTLLLLNTKVMTEYTSGFSAGFSGQSGTKPSKEILAFQQDLYNIILSYMQVWLIAFVPIATYFNWLIFKKIKYNLAEHFIFMCFVYGMQNWIGLPFWILCAFFDSYTIQFLVISTFLSVSYSIYACFSFFQPKNKLTGVVQSISAILLSYTSFLIAFIVAMGIYVVIQIKNGNFPIDSKRASSKKIAKP
jgi:hypothetical protein